MSDKPASTQGKQKADRKTNRQRPSHTPNLSEGKQPVDRKSNDQSSNNKLKLPEGFSFKHSLGQNFITDKNLLRAIVADAGVAENDVVLEIGAGAGTLTELLSKTAKRVVAVELDRSLIPLLEEKFMGTNVEVVQADILKLSDEQIKRYFDQPFKIVANLPYYITTPILFKFVEGNFSIADITVMVQKELALRLSARSGTKDYGGITVTLDCRGDIEYKRTVPRTVFHPQPNVDSAIIKFIPKPKKHGIADYELMDKVIKSAFAMRRKTLANNLCAVFNLTREQAEDALLACGLNTMTRGETLSTLQFIELTKKIGEKICK